MLVDLDKKDLLRLVKTTSPAYSDYEHPMIKSFGSHVGGMTDRWEWNNRLGLMTEPMLWEVYLLCKLP